MGKPVRTLYQNTRTPPSHTMAENTNYEFKGWVGEDPSAAKGNMQWKTFEPKPWEETDVDIKITHSGICGSDLHTISSGWGPANYPCVVVRVGSKAEGGIKVGDVVGVGAQNDSCLGRDGPCDACDNNNEQYCSGNVGTYNSKHRNGGKSMGGYALYHRCPSHFVIKIPDGLAPEAAAPMLCGGVTVYPPSSTLAAGPIRRTTLSPLAATITLPPPRTRTGRPRTRAASTSSSPPSPPPRSPSPGTLACSRWTAPWSRSAPLRRPCLCTPSPSSPSASVSPAP